MSAASNITTSGAQPNRRGTLPRRSPCRFHWQSRFPRQGQSNRAASVHLHRPLFAANRTLSHQPGALTVVHMPPMCPRAADRSTDEFSGPTGGDEKHGPLQEGSSAASVRFFTLRAAPDGYSRNRTSRYSAISRLLCKLCVKFMNPIRIERYNPIAGPEFHAINKGANGRGNYASNTPWRIHTRGQSAACWQL